MSASDDHYRQASFKAMINGITSEMPELRALVSSSKEHPLVQELRRALADALKSFGKMNLRKMEVYNWLKGYDAAVKWKLGRASSGFPARSHP